MIENIKDSNASFVLSESVKVGISPLKDVFTSDNILAYPDVEKGILYFDKSNIDLVKKNFTILQEKDNEWILKLPIGFGKFRIEPLAKLDFDSTKIIFNIPFIFHGAECHTYNANDCVDLIHISTHPEPGDFSFHAPIEFKACKPKENKTCYALITPLVFKFYNGHGCQGVAQNRTLNMIFCAPSA